MHGREHSHVGTREWLNADGFVKGLCEAGDFVMHIGACLKCVAFIESWSGV